MVTYGTDQQAQFNSGYTEIERLLATLDTEVRNGCDPLALQTLVERLQGQLPGMKESLDGIVNDANRDPLTGLLTRKAFFPEVFLPEYSRMQREHGGVIGLWFWDVDNLHAANESFGYATGDNLLATVANTLRESSRPHDRHMRWGGDEFGTYSADAKNPEGLKQRVQENIERKRILVPPGNFIEQGLHGRPVHEDDSILFTPGLSVGYATLEVERRDRGLDVHDIHGQCEDLFYRAQAAMQENKKERTQRGERLERGDKFPLIHIPSETVRTL